MTSLLYALHVIAARRGDGLRTEFFKRCAGQTADLLRLWTSSDSDTQVVGVPDLDTLPIGDLQVPINVK